MLAAILPRWPLLAPEAPVAKAAPTSPVDPGPTFQSTHLGAESPELRSLRRAEARLFPELGPLDTSSASSAPAVCAAPEREDWQASRSVDDEAHQSWPSGLKAPAIPIQQTARVARYIRYFSSTSEGRKLFSTWLRRSGRYRGVVTRALEQHDLPQDLQAIVFVESGFWPTAVSSAGATGLWQFMPDTARAYGLKVDRDYDERQSIFPATAAAADHLADLRARFQNWDLVLAAYNLGYKGLAERMDQYQTDDFWQLSQIPDALPRETALYVPKVQAVAVLLRNLEYFGFGDVQLAPPIDAAEIEIPSGVRLSLLARAAGTSIRRLREMNPQIRGDILPDRGEPITVFVPGNGVARARSMLPVLLSKQDNTELDRQVSPDFDWGRDDVGERGLSRLERTNPRASHQRPFWEKMDDSPSEQRLERTQPLRGEERERRGSGSWRVRGDDEQPASAPARSGANEERDEAPTSLQDLPLIEKPPSSEHVVLYRVTRGDTLSSLVEAFNVSRRQVVLDNRLRNPSHIMRGQLLKLRVPPVATTTSAANAGTAATGDKKSGATGANPPGASADAGSKTPPS